MVSGSGSGGVDRIGGSGADRVVASSAERGAGGATGRPGGTGDPVVRQELMGVLSEERIRDWTNQRVRAGFKAGRPPGPESSIGKVHQGGLNQRIQLLATDLLGAAAMAWAAEGRAADGREGRAADGPSRAPMAGRLGRSCRLRASSRTRCRACCAAGPTPSRAARPRSTRTIVAERVLGLPREPDPWQGRAVAGGPAQLTARHAQPLTGTGRSRSGGRVRSAGSSSTVPMRATR